MKARIDSQGGLWLDRVGEDTAQWCPYSGTTEQGLRSRCGDWCPKFRVHASNRTGRSFIQLSGGDRIDCSEIIDERPQ